MGPLDLAGDDRGDVLVIGWGGTFGALRQATEAMRLQGKKVSHVHLRWLWPFNPRLDDLVQNFDHLLVPELNTGQLRSVLRDRYLIDIKGLNKIQGKPFKVGEVVQAVDALLAGEASAEKTAARARPA
jgi:2-oxoglutarate ferredoxin oxidoreductase subunit alpha